MPTSNLVVTAAWTQVAADTKTELLITWKAPVIVEFATTATNVAPTVFGHELSRDDGVTRSVIGKGFVWARVVPSGSVLLVVTND